MKRITLQVKRHLFFIAAAVLFGIVAASFCSKAVLIIVFSVLLAVVLIVLFLSRKKSKFHYVFHGIRFAPLYCMIAFFIGIALMLGGSATLAKNELPTIRGSVYGRVERVTEFDYRTEMLLANVTFDSTEIQTDLNKKVLVTIYGKTDVKIGCYLLANGVMFSRSMIHSGIIDGYSISEGIGYEMDANSLSLIITVGEMTVFEKAREELKSYLHKNMGEESAAISYAILTGDSSYIGSQTRADFRAVGLSHIFAVSGLHIGLISFILLFILRRVCQNPWIHFFVIVSMLIVYNFFCGFSPSIVRSSIMCAFLLVSRCFGEANDTLTALSVAFLCCVLFSPLIVYYVGFMLSYAVVFAIAVCSPILEKVMKFLPNKIRGVLSVSISAQIGIIPLQAVYFHSLTPYSLLVNIFALPLFSFLYFALVICLCCPFLIMLVGRVFEGFIIAVEFLSTLPYANIVVSVGSGLLLLYYIVVYFATFSPPFSKTIKRIASMSLCAIYVVIFTFANLVWNGKKDSINFSLPYYMESVEYCRGGEEYFLSLDSYDKRATVLEDEDGVYALYIDGLLVLYGLNRTRYNEVLEIFDSAEFIVSDRYLSELASIYSPSVLFSFKETPYIFNDNYFSAQKYGKMRYDIAHFS